MKQYVVKDTKSKLFLDRSLDYSLKKDKLCRAFIFESEHEARKVCTDAGLDTDSLSILPVECTITLVSDIDEVTDALGLAPQDWLGLVKFFEETRRDKKNKKIAGYTEIGRKRKALELKTLSEGCWSYAVDAVLFALDNHYQGFSDGGQLYFKGDLGVYKAREALSKK